MTSPSAHGLPKPLLDLLDRFGGHGVLKADTFTRDEIEMLIATGLATHELVREDGRNGVEPHTDRFVVLTLRGMAFSDGGGW